MNRPILKIVTDFGPLLVFFVIYFYKENDLKVAIPPFIVATVLALAVVIEKPTNTAKLKTTVNNFFIIPTFDYY